MELLHYMYIYAPGCFINIKGVDWFFIRLKFSFNLYCSILSKFIFRFYLSNDDGFSSNVGKRRLYYQIVDSSPSSSFHVVVSSLSSLPSIAINLIFLYDSFI
jgi:hypothetical protein